MYPILKTIAAARKKFARCRKVQDFILDRPAAARCRIPCAGCGAPICEKPAGDAELASSANRFEYHPATKKVVGFHYDCAWQTTIDEAFRKFRNA